MNGAKFGTKIKRSEANQPVRELEGVGPGDFIYIFRDGQLPAACLIDRVNAAYAFSSDNNLCFRISDGVVDPCAHGKPCFGRLEIADPKVRAAMALRILEKELDRSFEDFRAQPMTKSRILEVLAVLNPKIWGVA